jgi:hypothetical protein
MEGPSMQPWMIVLSSAIGAIVVAAALAVPEVVHAPRSDITSTLLRHLPVFAVAGLAVYSLCAMLLTTANLIAGTLRLRHHLARTGSDQRPARRDWLAAFGTIGFRQLVSRFGPALAQSGRADGSAVLQTRFASVEIRREIARLHYILLARSHFLSALIVLAGIAGLGLAQDHGALPFQSGPIPTASAILITVGLLLLAVLGRITIDVTAEPLLETIAQLPAEQAEVGLLRRAVELLEVACNSPSPGETASADPPERLAAVIEQGHHALLNAVSLLSANTQSLEAAMRASAEALETTIRASTAPQRPIDDDKVSEASVLPELQAAIEELTSVLRQLSVAPDGAEEVPLGTDPVPPPRRNSTPRLARELRQLLQEIDTAR